MVVDDNERLRTVVRDVLQPAADLRVVGLASSGAEALRLAAEVAPDVVVMDLSMPNMDGVEATRHLVSRYPGLRIVVLTGSLERVHEAFAAGATAHLLKESPACELETRIREAVASR
ncbi:MAG: response regulator transcription factor [Actinobacteria bacterium]|nr:MAG: response regulator transcription factor [Actinomycetota bacterium]